MVDVTVVVRVEILVETEVNVVRAVTKRVVDHLRVSYEVTVADTVFVTCSVLTLVEVEVLTNVLVTVTGLRTEPLKNPANRPTTSRIAGNTLPGFIAIIKLLPVLTVSGQT